MKLLNEFKAWPRHKIQLSGWDAPKGNEQSKYKTMMMESVAYGGASILIKVNEEEVVIDCDLLLKAVQLLHSKEPSPIFINELK